MKSPAILALLCAVGSFSAHSVYSAETTQQQVVIGAAPSSSLNFNASQYVARQITAGGKTLAVRAYEHIVYIAKPVDPDHQQMNIYVPEAYFHGGSIGGYTAQSAPIFLPNYVGGYMPGLPGTLDGSGMPGPANQPNSIVEALARGYVIATPGARGRTSKSADGLYTGKAPAAIVDLKAAVRYLHFNDLRMPGNAKKIISNGTSAGGALSALLGSSGNSADYQPELLALGAAAARDDIYAVSAYCPIANLEHADAAYEWQFNGINNYQGIEISMLDFKMQRKEVAGTLSAEQIKLSNELKITFPDYVNSLKLHSPQGALLRLDAAGNGSFKEYIKSLVIASAQTAINQGQNLSQFDWLHIENRRVRSLNYDRYLRYLERQKLPPAFDGVDLSTGENQLFGTPQLDKRHFTGFSVAHDTVTPANRADEHVVAMMNPMTYIGAPGANNAPYWRIRHGAKDRDTSLAIPTIMALALHQHNIAVDFALPWGRPHSGDYDLDALFSWMKQISAM